MKDDERFLLITIIVFLASLYVFSATFWVPIRSGVLQYFSGGIMITSGVCLLSIGFNKIKNKIKEKKEEKAVSETQKQIHKEQNYSQDKIDFNDIETTNSNDETEDKN